MECGAPGGLAGRGGGQGAGDDAALAGALYARGRALNRLGQSQEALGALLECVAFLPGGQLRAQALAWREAACAQRNLACDSEALEYLGLALRLAQEAADPALEVDLIEDLAQAHAGQEDHGAALHALHGSLRVRRTLPGQPGLAHTLVRLAQVQLRACAPAAGGPGTGAAASTPDASPAGGDGPDLQAAQGTLLEALHLLDGPSGPRGADEPDPGERLALRGEAHSALAHVHLRRGDPAAAQESALAALAALRQAGATRQALQVLPELARAQVAQGEAASALAGLRAALTLNPRTCCWPSTPRCI
ncbi:hypothetical protein [Deinococcus aquaticus]|uniref:hypothetical protein n=1 Tax=Deinococcus aquaticus TaxID=328692 RepID=UPI00360CB9C0